MGWANRALLPGPSLSLPLFNSFSLVPCTIFSPARASPLPSPTQSHNLLPLTGDGETDSTRWQIYWHPYEVKDFKPSVMPEDPLPGRQDGSTIYICWGPSKGQLPYISATWDCISQKIAFTSLSSWKARIFSFFKTTSGFLSWCFFTSGQMSIWTICVRFPPRAWRRKSWESFSPWPTYRTLHVRELAWGLLWRSSQV